jgi:hypothetical protein
MSAVTVGLIAASLAIRLASRGGDVPGWDILSPADGLWYVATMSSRDLVRTVLATWDQQPWYNFGPKLIVVLLPGALTWWCPWSYWAIVVTAVSVAMALILLAVALDLRAAWWIIGIAWAASPAFVSHTITGLGHVTAILAHALALVIVLRARRPLLTLALCGLEYAIAWQVQDLGRTAFVVFLAAAVGLEAPWSTRLVWLLAGAAQGWDTWAHPTRNSYDFSQATIPTALQLFSTVGESARLLIIKHWSDLPTLIVTGVIALVILKRDRIFWWFVVLAQLAILLDVALMRSGPMELFPRRILVFDFYAVALVAALWSQRPRCQPWLVAVLLLGTCWQVADAVVFARTAQREWGFPLPYTQSTYDYQVVYQDVDLARAIADDVAAGRHVLLLWNKLTYEENCSNPSGVVERVALVVGWTAYQERVFWFGKPGDTCFTHFSPRDIATAKTVLASITEPENWVVWDAFHPADATHNQPQQERERAAIRDALQDRFLLVPTPVLGVRPGASTVARYVLRPAESGPGEATK